jgi:hypothetical protein
MPNWCYNYALLTCPSKEIYDKLLDAITKQSWFKTFAPLGPDEDDWTFEKANEVWNTKWPPQELEIGCNDETEFIIDLTFNTAWSPPIGVYKTMYANFGITTTAYYEELGNEFFGKCAYSPYEEWDDTFDIPSNQTELDETRTVIGVGSELDEFMNDTWEQLKEQWELEEKNEDEGEGEGEGEGDCDKTDNDDGDSDEDDDGDGDEHVDGDGVKVPPESIFTLPL